VWIITPLPENQRADVQVVEDLILSLGATPHRMDPTTHDQLFARISHFPQILSTLLAGSLLKVEAGVELSGQGLRDMTRLAESDSKLWSQIISLNSEPLLRSIADFKSLLIELEVTLSKMDQESIVEIIRRGQEGRKLISGKHGGKPRDYMLFHIVIDDRPGVLGELFALCGEAEVNVEDLDLEHSPNQETGLITIAIAPEQDEIFASALKDKGWRFHRSGGLA
jgi:prephenate dehydrogenase